MSNTEANHGAGSGAPRPARTHQHLARITWSNRGPNFLKGQYSREHAWSFDGGVTVAASPAPTVVPVPWSNPACVDPEEALVASAASCHMLTFLWLASKQGWEVASYEDAAVGLMTKNEAGVYFISKITLNPKIVWTGPQQPSAEEISQLHDRAHHECFIANTIRSEVIVQSAPAN